MSDFLTDSATPRTCSNIHRLCFDPLHVLTVANLRFLALVGVGDFSQGELSALFAKVREIGFEASSECSCICEAVHEPAPPPKSVQSTM